jgi:putative transposase
MKPAARGAGRVGNPMPVSAGARGRARTWHREAVCLTRHGTRQDLRRAVEHGGTVLDLLVPRRRDKAAAKPFFRELLQGGRSVPGVIVTGQRKSDEGAKRDIGPRVEHRQHRYVHNRAGNSQPPPHQRERALRRFTSAAHAPRFRAASGPIRPPFRPRRQGLPVGDDRRELRPRCQRWREITGTALAA